MKTQELPLSDIQISSMDTTAKENPSRISDNFILTFIFVLGILGAFYILNTATSPSTVNSQGYTIEYSSVSR